MNQTWKVIKTEAAYQKAIKRTMVIFRAEEGTAEADELALLLVLVKDYEEIDALIFKNNSPM